MNITELDSFKLSDAVKFHNRLNPKIWGQDEHLLPEVREKLMAIAADFQEFLGVSDLQVKDITVSGSNAAFSYTLHSDIDLHLVVEFPQQDEIYQELFNAKKYQYNDEHNLAISGIPVELYVQNAAEPPVSQGEYSVMNNDWIQVPRKKRARIDDTCVRTKVEDLDARIHNSIKTGNPDAMGKLWDKIKHMRQSGLDEHGEFGCENIAFKILRTNGCIKDLRDARTAAQDRELSLQEQNKPKQRKVWGFAEDATATPDGVSATTCMFLNEEEPSSEEIVNQFIQHTAQRLGIEHMPKVLIHDDPTWSEEQHSFGMYQPEIHTLNVSLPGRHLLDVLRTVAHELTHCRQHEIEALPNHAGETGSDWENEANASAGIIMRDFADAHPEYFNNGSLKESSGYIPTAAQANDPRFKMALSVDVHPGQTGKEANKMALHTDAQGKPALLMKTANLRESLEEEFEAFLEGKSYGYGSTPLSQVPGEREDELGNQEATGPEFPPQMPAGTTKIDVSDLTDWYRLGMDVSDLDDADPKDYNQGPPQTIMVFPSDEAEQGYLKQFKRLGLKTHDMDPDIEGGEDLYGKHMKELSEEFALLEEEFLGEIKMTGKNLSQLAKDISGVQVGLEFEMIVPGVSDPDDESEQEPNYDEDERVRDIDDAVGFFDDGDYNSPRTIRDLREEMEGDYQNWVIEQLDEEWYSGSGREYFEEYLQREDPFDDEEAEEDARNELRAQYGNELDDEEFEKMLFALVDEKREAYAQEQWDEQGRNFDHAREEFDDERRHDLTEQDWLENQGMRYASDVQNNYSDVTWPYWTSSNSSDGEEDVKRIALDFMNAMGMSSVAVSSSYHGSYEKWNGDSWVDVGREKPNDCFSIEPDGSLQPDDDDSEFGLEFVSPPIPLEDIGTVMKKVQTWAGANGVYTGLNNKTSMHTNISVPGYDIKNLDYLKAALLLGDEHVLREFERFGNTYAKPAIEKIRQLVKSKPEKAKELLDKMKSQLNAEASKLIHSGVTDKFTSINTKDNRIEFRSPGGDYLSDIADNPKKLQDAINRMVVTMDAAMDPNKYKAEYQKKLYKLLTGQESGREGATGAKKELKKDDKDLLNLFSRYSAGELPKQALKSFVRQAQLQRKVAKGDTDGEKYWWNVNYNGQRMEVVATNKKEAKEVAAKEWGLTSSQADTITSTAITVLRPYTAPPAGSELERIERQAGVEQGTTVAGRPNNPEGDWYLKNDNTNEIFYRFNAANYADAYTVLQQWKQENPDSNINAVYGYGRNEPAQQDGGTYRITTTGGGLIAGDEYGNDQTALERAQYWAQRRGVDVVVRNPQGQEVGRVDSSGTITPTTQPQAPAQQNQGNWGIWINANDRFANQPGSYARGETPPLIRFPSREAAESWLEQQRAARPNLRSDIEVREIAPRLLPGSTLDLQRQRAAQAQSSEYELYRISDGRAVTAPAGNPIVFRADSPEDAESKIARYAADFNLGAPELFAVRSVLQPVSNINLFPEIGTTQQQGSTDQQAGGLVDVAPRTLTTPGQGQQVWTGEWKVIVDGEEVYRFGGVGNSQADANRVGRDWVLQQIRQRTLNPGDGADIEILPVMGEA